MTWNNTIIFVTKNNEYDKYFAVSWKWICAYLTINFSRISYNWPIKYVTSLIHVRSNAYAIYVPRTSSVVFGPQNVSRVS